jgi:hypothetical protein
VDFRAIHGGGTREARLSREEGPVGELACANPPLTSTRKPLGVSASVSSAQIEHLIGIIASSSHTAKVAKA